MTDGSQLYGRKCRVIIGTDQAIQIEDLRFQFKVKKTTKKEPNECQLTIYNLSEKSRSGLQTKGVKLILEAGYTNTIAQIFSGDVRFSDHKHEGPDWITKVESADGEVNYRYQMVSESFKGGTAVVDVFTKLAGKTGFDVAAAIAFVRQNVQEVLAQGYSAVGPASEQVDRVLSGRGLEWSIQDNKLQVLKTGGVTSDTAVLLRAGTGLVGSPEHGTSEADKKAQILKVKSLLQPGIKPGGTVHIEADGGLTGDFRVQTVVHQGDTDNGEWYSECEVTPV